MAKIDVEVFTNEIEKTYTILKQNLIIIDTIKELIAQGNLSEDAIASLQNALSTTNTKLENLNTFTKQEFLRTNQKISTVETTQENMNNVMPTDINTDSNGYLILEHNGVEITGQKKQVKVFSSEDQKKLEELATELTYNSSTNTFEIGSNLFVYNDLYLYSGNIIYNSPQNPGNSIDLSTPETIYLNGTDADNDFIQFDLYGNQQHGLTDKNTKTIFGKSILKEPENNNIDLYNHIISIDMNSNILLNIFVKASSSNLKVNSLNDLTTLLNAKENTIIECNAFNEGQTYTRNVDITGLIYTNSTWKYGMVYMTPQGPFIDNEELITTATINDVVTPI